MIDFTEQLQEIAVEYLRRILSILEFVEMPKHKEEKTYRTAFIDPFNRFWSLFSQASPSIFKQV
jgi:hypothetical protein